MTVGKRTRKSIIAAVFAALCALAFGSLFCARTALAEDAPAKLSLTPVEVQNTDITYMCFDSPAFVYADVAGILVAGANSTVAVSAETEITANYALPADKVYRHAEHGDHAEYLIALDGGELKTLRGDAVSVFASDKKFTDFAVGGDKLYALAENSLTTLSLGAQGIDQTTAQTVELMSDELSSVHAEYVAVLDGTVYVTTDSAFGRRQDVCTVAENGKLTAKLRQSNEILSLAADGSVGNVYALTRDELAAYSVSTSGGLVKKHYVRGALFSVIHAYNSSVYALDSLNGVHKLSADLSSDRTLLAASSSAKGFFNTPTGVAVKNSALYIADSMNGRVAIYGRMAEYVGRQFISPVSVACDSRGAVYVAYEYDKIGVFDNGDFSADNERVIAVDSGAVKQIAVDYDGDIYILTDGGLYKSAGGSADKIEKIGTTNETHYKAITLSVGRETLYALTDNAVVKFKDNKTAVKVCDAPSDAVSLAVDIADNAFILAPDGITVYNGTTTKTVPLALNGEAYTLGGKSGHIALCTVENEFVSHGDVIITDTVHHRIFKADGKTALGVKLIDDSYEVPDVAGNTDPEYYGEGLIRTAVRDADVYSLPMETRAVYTIKAGRNVIVPKYDLDETREYSLILIDDVENGKLVQGYVYKNALSEPLPYSAPPAPTGAIYNAATPIYKYPSRNAATVRDYSAVEQNVKFIMLDFVESYRDDYGYLWYRVSLDSKHEGYVLSINISTTDYEPIFIRPAYDAEIISYKNSKFAAGYKLQDGEYIKIAELPTGTKVEIVGAFDSSKRYTQVKYVDAERGTLTCYVETVYIEYEGINIVLIVAVIVIVVTVLLAAIIICRVMRNKKKRLEPDDERDR